MAQGTHHPGVADQNAIARKARDLAKKTADGDRLTVEFSSEPTLPCCRMAAPLPLRDLNPT
jgi:hypothetical protein